MLQRLVFLLKYSLFWLLLFIFFRLIFLVYNLPSTIKLPINTIFLTFYNGLRLDISLTGYIMAFVCLFVSLTFWTGKKTYRIFINSLTICLLFIFVLISIVDMELYRNWGFRMDGSVLLYLKTPKEALASTRLWLIIVLTTFCFLTIWLSYNLYKYTLSKYLDKIPSGKWYFLPIFLVLTGLSIIPMRGGIGIAPIRTGSVYFSPEPYANHAAINVQWNFVNSLLYMNNGKMDNYMPSNEADQIYSTLTKTEKQNRKLLLNTQEPNVLIIILESFTAKAIEVLGGVKDLTPNLNQLSHEGILFTNCYANGDRSDKGIVSILSGYPAQPTTSIIKYTEKASKLPHLSKLFNDKGYQSAFYYGGEIDFANMKSYFITGGFQKLVTLSEFDEKDMNSKWGAHDHIVFQRLYQDLKNEQKPFFTVFFTLSSHEPFEVPMISKFNGQTEEAHFLNSIHYTDSCVGDFISKAKLEPWWNNTLVILVADHGNRLPGNTQVSDPVKFHIPMIWLGGALNVSDTIIDQMINQSDIPTILGNQLNMDISVFSFGKNVIDMSESFAIYAFNNGFGFLKNEQFVVWDNQSSKIIEKSTFLNDSTLLFGRAMMQKVLEDFNTK